MAGADVSGALRQSCRGYALSDVSSARSALQPLMLAYGFEAVEREGRLVFRQRDGRLDQVLDAERLALCDEIDGALETTRAPEAEMAGRVRLSFIEAEGDYADTGGRSDLPG